VPLRSSLLALVGALLAAPLTVAQPVSLIPLGTYRTGVFEAGAAEIAAYDAATRRLFFVNADANTVSVLDASDAANPTFLYDLDLAAFGGGVNSVAVKNGIVAVAVEAEVRTDPGRVAFFSNKGFPLGSVVVGALPDAVTFSPDGRYVVVACEGEPNADYTVDPEGTVAIVDLAGGVPASAALVGFTDFNAGGPRNGEITGQPSIRIYGPGASVAQDLEPEYAAVSPDGATAYVTLQENNAGAVIDLAAATVVRIDGLGFKDHTAAANALDPSDRDGGIHIGTWPVFGMYQPDGVAAFEAGGQTYLVTANEGDARDYDAFGEEARVSSLDLDPAAFPDAATLQLPQNLGRLNVTEATGDTDGDGDFDALYVLGARSFSIRNAATGALVFDSGDEFERVTAERYPAYFNASNTENTLDSRSDNKGPEPEGVVVGEVDGRTLAFVGLERIGGVMVYDLTDPAAPAFAGYVNNRDFTEEPEGDGGSNPAAGDLGPEGLVFVPAADSPTGRPLLITSNEISGSVTFHEVRGGGFTLTLLHNNDGESELLPTTIAGQSYGGAARFVRLMRRLREEGRAETDGVVTVSSGDNFLAGPEFYVSLQRGVPYYDAIALEDVRYDAVAIGNHEFDFGPEVLANFIRSFDRIPPFVSANLDVSAEPSLAGFARSGRIAPSTVVEVGGRRVGIVGATTPALPRISSPRDVVVDPDVRAAVQAEVDSLTAAGVDLVVLISHLQSIAEDTTLIPQLRGVDVAVAGGGDELLANPDDVLIPGDAAEGPYPLLIEDADGRTVPVVTTSGGYRYVGRLVLEFDDAGALVGVDEESGPVRVAAADGTGVYGPVVRRVEEPLTEALAGLAATVVGQTAVPLDGVRNHVRTRETNLGDLVADALLATADSLNEAFGVPDPDVALQNGGGIRNDAVVPVGPLTELTTFDVLPFANFVAVVPDVPAAQFKEVLENAYSRVEFRDGRFTQVAGLAVNIDTTATAQVVDADGNVTTPGERVRHVTLADGTVLVADGVVVDGAPAVTVATIDFLARGGDFSPYRGADFTTLGVTYQQAFRDFVAESLGGLVPAADYPEGGEGRITFGKGNAVAGEPGAGPRSRSGRWRRTRWRVSPRSRSTSRRPPRWSWRCSTSSGVASPPSSTRAWRRGATRCGSTRRRCPPGCTSCGCARACSCRRDG
jgi:2',3'-cyclic-nucleotide 2'-phosphodiesterase/3'-nucleotidase/5'-nucleotidase